LTFATCSGGSGSTEARTGPRHALRGVERPHATPVCAPRTSSTTPSSPSGLTLSVLAPRAGVAWQCSAVCCCSFRSLPRRRRVPARSSAYSRFFRGLRKVCRAFYIFCPTTPPALYILSPTVTSLQVWCTRKNLCVALKLAVQACNTYTRRDDALITGESASDASSGGQVNAIPWGRMHTEQRHLPPRPPHTLAIHGMGPLCGLQAPLE
jgi:hypothetical protein